MLWTQLVKTNRHSDNLLPEVHSCHVLRIMLANITRVGAASVLILYIIPEFMVVSDTYRSFRREVVF